MVINCLRFPVRQQRIEVFVSRNYLKPICDRNNWVAVKPELPYFVSMMTSLVVQKSPKSQMHGESHDETGVTEKGMTWDAQVFTQKATPYVNPPTLSSTANPIESMDCS